MVDPGQHDERLVRCHVQDLGFGAVGPAGGHLLHYIHCGVSEHGEHGDGPAANLAGPRKGSVGCQSDGIVRGGDLDRLVIGQDQATADHDAIVGAELQCFPYGCSGSNGLDAHQALAAGLTATGGLGRPGIADPGRDEGSEVLTSGFSFI